MSFCYREASTNHIETVVCCSATPIEGGDGMGMVHKAEDLKLLRKADTVSR